MIQAGNSKGEVENYYSAADITAMNRCLEEFHNIQPNIREYSEIGLPDLVSMTSIFAPSDKTKFIMDVVKGNSGDEYARIISLPSSTRNRFNDIYVRVNNECKYMDGGVWDYKHCSVDGFSDFLKEEFDICPLEEDIEEIEKIKDNDKRKTQIDVLKDYDFLGRLNNTILDYSCFIGEYVLDNSVYNVTVDVLTNECYQLFAEHNPYLSAICEYRNATLTGIDAAAMTVIAHELGEFSIKWDGFEKDVNSVVCDAILSEDSSILDYIDLSIDK